MGHSDHIKDCAAVEACPPCATHTPLRNHYFFGKLMDVPDFDVEQLYVVDKFRRHHARLHGTGVVCGLEVVAHGTPACRDRYLVVKPGTALDCCGNEILVIDEEVLDIKSFPAVAAIYEDPNDDVDHVLQLCIRYRECPTEEVPVLFDECGCDDTRCAPNRVLETYAFDILVDPKLAPPLPPHAPTLEWVSTITLAGANAIAIDGARLYVAADQAPSGGVIQQYMADTLAFVASRPFPTRVLGIALDASGQHLFAAIAGALAADPAQLRRIDTTTPSGFATGGGAGDVIDIPGSDGAQSVRLLMLDSGELASLVVKGGTSTLQVWDVVAPTLAAIAGRSANVAAAFVDWSIGSDKRVYAAEVAGKVDHFDMAVNGLDPQIITLASSDVVAFAIAKSTGPDMLAWAEGTPHALKLAKLDGTLPRSVSLPEKPVAFTLDAGSQFAYVLEQPAAGNAVVQVVDVHRLLAGEPNVLGASIDVGPAGTAIALHGKLFAAYADGVAVLEVVGGDCADYLKPHACPACDTADCVVLATVLRWRPGRTLEDVTDPPSDPLADAAANKARLDNLLGRQIVPSVTDLMKAVLCLLDHGGAGGVGPQGPPGNDGKDGVDGKDGKDGLNGTNGTNGTNGVDGKDGVGLDPDLPHVCDINWMHGTRIDLAQFAKLLDQGLIIAFDTEMVTADFSIDTVIVQLMHTQQIGDAIALNCWCELDLRDRIRPGQLDTRCAAESPFKAGSTPTDAIRIDIRQLEQAFGQFGSLRVRVILKGDFIRGKHLKLDKQSALDGDHLPKLDGGVLDWLRPGDKRVSGDGVEGGDFESWFSVVRQG